MKKTYLLDCTLRDGGFINNWNFGEECIISIFERLCLAKIEIVEVGYLRDYVSEDIAKTEFPNTDSINKVISLPVGDRPMVVAIIDYGNCTIDNISEANNSVLDGIRVTFKKHELLEAMEFCHKIKAKGYEVFVQPVSIMDYTPQDVINLINESNKFDPFEVCIVDTYGFMHKRDLLRYFSLMDTMLNPDIKIGYHSHNNFQLAYANAIELVEQITNRDLVIDCSAFGMGKGAGNANTELLALYMNENFGENYDIDQILEIIDTYIEKERKKNYWGYSLKYYLAASNDCHHQYINYLIEKKTLSIKSINEIISMIDLDYKTKYDKNLIENLYQTYQKKIGDSLNGYQSLESLLNVRNVLIIAPGASVSQYEETIRDYVYKQKCFVISLNYISNVVLPDAVFVSNSKRYSQIATTYARHGCQAKIVATTNIVPTNLVPDIFVNYSDLMDINSATDNSGTLLLKLLVKLGLNEVAVAGFDGFKKESNNYVDKQFDFSGDYIEERNSAIATEINKLKEKISIKFITPSIFE